MTFLDIFSKKEELNDTLSKRITNLEEQYSIIKARLDSIELTNADLRNKVLRKIQRLPDNEQDTKTALKAGQKVR